MDALERLGTGRSGVRKNGEGTFTVTEKNAISTIFFGVFKNLNVFLQNNALNDDTLLEKMKISNKSDEELLNGSKNLSQIEQAVLYCALYDLQKNNPHHELTFEEMLPFIDVLLDQPENWCVQACTLFLRTKLEASSSRRVERSLLQLEVMTYYIFRGLLK